MKRLPDSRRLVVALDDTLLRKSGQKTPGVAYRRGPFSPAFQTNLILAQRFLQFSFHEVHHRDEKQIVTVQRIKQRNQQINPQIAQIGADWEKKLPGVGTPGSGH